MGGFWEAEVKFVKFHHLGVLGDSKVTYEGMVTVLAARPNWMISQRKATLSDQ